MATQPTFVIGIGQAGVKIMDYVAQVAEENDDRDKFGFAAMDTDPNTLNQRPDGALRVSVEYDDAFTTEDVNKYPFFTETMENELGDVGALRKRPLGRYNLDSRGDGGYSNVYDDIWDEIWDHYQTHAQALSERDASFNIFYIHSAGGGTGSGTFPLLTAMLMELKDTLEGQTNNVDAYLAGVGVVPEIKFDPEIKDPPGEEIYYPNAFASLNDLKMLEKSYMDAESLQLPSYAQTHGSSTGTSSASNVNEFEITNVPFDDYWLIGVDEGRLEGGIGAGGTDSESYAVRTDQVVARGIHAITQLSESVENWTQGKSFIGTMDQTEVRVPHEEVQEYLSEKADKQEKEERVEEIPDEISSLRERKSELEGLKEHLSQDQIDDEDLQQSITERVEDEFYSGVHIIENKSEKSLINLLDQIEEDFEEDGKIEALIVATSLLLDKLNESRGLPRVKQDRKETIQNLWSRYDMGSRHEYGGDSLTTVEGRASALKDFISEKRDEYKQIREEWDPGVLGQLRDALPPIAGPFESEREEAERLHERLQEDYAEIERVEGEWGRVSEMRQILDERRVDVREAIDDMLSEKNDEISALQSERERVEQEIEDIERDLRDRRQTLAQAKTGQRLDILPIVPEVLEEFEPRRADDLTSIRAYEREGLIDEDKITFALQNAVTYSEAWNKSVLDQEMAPVDWNYPYDRESELWSLYQEENGEYQDDIEIAVDADKQKEVGEQSSLDFLSDPYRMEYVSFARKGPTPALKLYQHLDDLARNGTLDDWSGQYDGNHLRAFAYLEWYGREVKNAFDITDRAEVQRPAEMDYARVDHPDLSGEGEIKAWIRTNGLDGYMWEGLMMDHYEAPEGERFRGWKQTLSNKGITFTQLQKSTPSVDLKKQWLANQADWEDILQAYQQGLVDQTGLKLNFGRE